MICFSSTPQTTTSTAGAVVASRGTAVAKPSNTGAVSGVANVGIRRAEIKQGKAACEWLLLRFPKLVVIVSF